MTTTAQLAAPTARTVDPDIAWQQLLARDTRAPFFYGVTTTGVFCRVGCASRRPRRENVRFFASVDDASRAGFRPCARCKPATAAARGNALDAVRSHFEKNPDRVVSLGELARVAGQSPFTIQRQFKQAYGVSPLQYQRGLRAQRLRTALKEGNSVTDAIYNAGFGSSSRAYEGAPLGMTPSRFAHGGRGERIGYATAFSPFGWMIVGVTERGLCWLALADNEQSATQTLRDEFPAATLARDESLVAQINRIIANLTGEAPNAQLAAPQVPLDLRGTVFQLRVWEALRRIPRGETRSYSQLAAELGNPKATRAVARACATNRVAVLVPCHRVVGVNGSLTGYRWGVDRKLKLLAGETGREQGSGNSG